MRLHVAEHHGRAADSHLRVDQRLLGVDGVCGQRFPGIEHQGGATRDERRRAARPTDHNEGITLP